MEPSLSELILLAFDKNLEELPLSKDFLFFRDELFPRHAVK